MSYFNHGLWESVRADLDLQPLPHWAPDVIARLLAGEVFEFPARLSYEQEVLQRLHDLGLVEGVPNDWCWDDDEEVQASDFLRSIEARGHVAELAAGHQLAQGAKR